MTDSDVMVNSPITVGSPMVVRSPTIASRSNRSFGFGSPRNIGVSINPETLRTKFERQSGNFTVSSPKTSGSVFSCPISNVSSPRTPRSDLPEVP